VLFGDFCGHNGTIFGFSSETFYLPAEDAVVVINANRNPIAGKYYELLLKVCERAVPLERPELSEVREFRGRARSR
jgi:D-alanyl-D-alanine carboxypeptidase